MLRVYFVFEDPFDDSGVNLSFADVPTREPSKAFARIEQAAASGELWRAMYPENEKHPYTLIKSKMSYVDISALPEGREADTLLPL